jgi:ABC-2 type transport system permease protein
VTDQVRPNVLRAALAVVRRTFKTNFRYSTWFLPYLVWPVVAPFGYVFTSRALSGPNNEALQSFAQLSGTTDFTMFVIIGTTFWFWFNMMLWDLGYSFRREQMRGTMESNFLAPVPKAFMALGAFLVSAVVGLATVVMACVTAYLVWGLRFTGSAWGLCAVVLASVPSIYGIGLIFASAVLLLKEVNAMVFFVRGIMTVFCGVVYPIAALPGWMQAISRALPLTYSIEAVRVIAAGGGLGDVLPHLRFLGFSGAILLLLGFACFEGMQAHLIKTGTLGQY